MTRNLDLLTQFKKKDGVTVIFGNNHFVQIKGHGVLTNGLTSFTSVAYVDGLKHNLLSINQLCYKGF